MTLPPYTRTRKGEAPPGSWPTITGKRERKGGKRTTSGNLEHVLRVLPGALRKPIRDSCISRTHIYKFRVTVRMRKKRAMHVGLPRYSLCSQEASMKTP